MAKLLTLNRCEQLFCTFLLLSWGNDDTEELIKILKEYDVPATFFVVGAWVDKY
ncbi:MAG: polysaccharide deacetylase family protein, partial [Acutalibacteraceae bacterium]|nr:polysaccharide deacetylase family protein [Acutalibacteraceae bacterium]